MRAGMASYALGIAGRGDVPVVAGAAGSLGGFGVTPGLPDLSLHWPGPIDPEPSPPGAAPDLLAANAEAGATIVCVGPWTNLALLEAARPGLLLASTRVVVMGGYYVRPPRPGLGSWTPEMYYNVHQDALAARVVWNGARRSSCRSRTAWRCAHAGRTSRCSGGAASSPGSSHARWRWTGASMAVSSAVLNASKWALAGGPLLLRSGGSTPVASLGGLHKSRG